MQVLMMPDYRADNPYQSLLEQALTQLSVSVRFPQGYRRILPFYRAVIDCSKKAGIQTNILHLHWLGPYIKGNWVLLRWLYAFKFLIDIWLVKRAGVKVVWTVHNLVSHDTQNACLELWIRRRLAQSVDQLIVHNESSKVAVSELYRSPLSCISVIPIGHYRGVYPPGINAVEARRLLNLPDTGHVFLWQGILRPYKGVKTLIKTWIQHQNVFTDHTLLVAGPAFDEDYANQISALIASYSNIRLSLVFIEDNRLPLFFSAASVVVLPFKQILTSSSLMLAMSYGKPVIAPRIGGIPETVGEADALLYEPEDELGLLSAMNKSLEINLTELSRATEKVCDLNGWSHIAKKTEQLYQLLINI